MPDPTTDANAQAAKVAALQQQQANTTSAIAAGQSLQTDAAYVRQQLEPLARALTARRQRNDALKAQLKNLQEPKK